MTSSRWMTSRVTREVLRRAGTVDGDGDGRALVAAQLACDIVNGHAHGRRAVDRRDHVVVLDAGLCAGELRTTWVIDELARVGDRVAGSALSPAVWTCTPTPLNSPDRPLSVCGVLLLGQVLAERDRPGL